ncbi:hypothetical protein CO613_09675 [Lysobacteraceae bacterium NML07-0707]|nr:hypothetical protein CO613_09675 [Xanthomonadaceae bacterium NML07-0707]
MHYLVELYTPNAAWKALDDTQRQQFLGAIGNAMGELSGLGIEVLTLAETAPGIDKASPHQFVGIWRFATPEARDVLLAGIKASGWYDYFEHVNAGCASVGFEQHLAALMAT